MNVEAWKQVASDWYESRYTSDIDKEWAEYTVDTCRRKPDFITSIPASLQNALKNHPDISYLWSPVKASDGMWMVTDRYDPEAFKAIIAGIEPHTHPLLVVRSKDDPDDPDIIVNASH